MDEKVLSDHILALPKRRPATLRRYLSVFGVFAVLMAAFALGLMPGVEAAGDTGPDLTVEIQIIPQVPDPGVPATVRMIFRNRGTLTSSPATFYLYVNPAQQPPLAGTAPSFFSGVPSLQPGGSSQLERSVTFGTVGCDHNVYVWVDRDQLVTDADRSNNLIGQQVCVGVQCEVDAFEDDGAQDNAVWLTTGAAQDRSFCRNTAGGLTTTGDQDWVKFTAFAGLTYTLATTNTGVHTDPQISLFWSGAPTQALSGPAAAAVWQPGVTGVYLAQIRNQEDAEGSGPLTNYQVTLSAVPAVTDDFEPDDACSQARDITVDGSRQTRLFQAPGDTDWVKFSIVAGESFALVADNTAQGVNPIITLFSSCSQARSNNTVNSGVNRVESRSVGDQVYYARIANQNPDRFGADAKYDISVLASACAPDGFEEDDTVGQAVDLPLNTVQTRAFCPAGDQDWVRLNLTADQIYVIKTSNLGFASDTVLELWDDKGNQIAVNDDYDYVKASRITFQPSASGVYYAKVRHLNPTAAGPNTNYDLTLETGFCVPDDAETDGDNGPGDARTVSAVGTPTPRNFCADSLSNNRGDQDWIRVSALPGARYHVRTTDLGPNADPVLRLYDRNGVTLLQTSDDNGAGLGAELVFTPTVAGDYFVQVTQYNSRVVGRETNYSVRVEENLPPTPTPSPTPPPTATPTPPPPPDPSDVRTLILVNRERLAAVHGNGDAGLIMAKLFELADADDVDGAVIQVEDDPAVAAAYTTWTATADSLLSVDLANDVAGAIRNRVLSFAAGAPDLKYMVIVGDDRVIPFRRVPEAVLAKNENEYAAELAGGNTVGAALANDMILTDDFYADIEPSQWKGNDLFIPDYAIGRLIEEPGEIIGQIDIFLGGKVINTQRALVTGYDFVQDSATLMRGLMVNDGIVNVSSADYIGSVWPGDALRATMLTDSTPNSRYDLISINGHATHISIGVPDVADIQAGEIVSATNDFVRSLVYNVGCHGGLNDPLTLDLPQAFVGRGAVYVGNTGYGWGGGGIVYSESLMRNFTRAVLTETKAEIGPALTAAKQTYVSRARVFGGYDAKILMQTTLYGLPMFEITSGGALSDEDPFPSLEDAVSPPGAFSDQANVGSFGYGLPQSFGAFGSDDANPDYRLDLDGNIVFDAGAPIQPGYYRDLSAPNAGSLRGVIFRGGVYTETITEAPIALAYNEYITDTTTQDFSAAGWYPSVPFGVQSSALDPSLTDTVVLALGQYDSQTGAQRVFDRMSFDTYYSDSADTTPGEVTHVDAVLDEAMGKGLFKVEATDPAGVARVVVAYTAGDGVWSSQDLLFDAPSAKWTGVITGTVNTRYFVQVVDGAGNISIDDNKGRYHPLLPPLPLIEGRSIEQNIYLPTIQRGN
ncbi:hypothetical protein GC175_02290 [bacterium]|nr:hypothetical protein [bacterium]